jgi:hypothetical protein
MYDSNTIKLVISNSSSIKGVTPTEKYKLGNTWFISKLFTTPSKDFFLE